MFVLRPLKIYGNNRENPRNSSITMQEEYVVWENGVIIFSNLVLLKTLDKTLREKKKKNMSY